MSYKASIDISRDALLACADAADELSAHFRRVARSIREAVESECGGTHVCELCGQKFDALVCNNGDWIDADWDIVGYRLPIHKDDPLHEGAANGTTCWRCGHEYMGDSIGECVECGEVFAWSNVEHGDLMAANDDVVGRQTPDGPICAACDCDCDAE